MQRTARELQGHPGTRRMLQSAEGAMPHHGQYRPVKRKGSKYTFKKSASFIVIQLKCCCSKKENLQFFAFRGQNMSQWCIEGPNCTVCKAHNQFILHKTGIKQYFCCLTFVNPLHPEAGILKICLFSYEGYLTD